MDEIDKNISFKRPKSDKAKNLTFFMFKREEIENKREVRICAKNWSN